jgi:hypothetical protein
MQPQRGIKRRIIPGKFDNASEVLCANRRDDNPFDPNGAGAGNAVRFIILKGENRSDSEYR